MGNAIESNCLKDYGECHYWGAMHGEFDFKEERFKNCNHCTRQVRERLLGHGIYEVYKESKHGS